MLRTHLYYAAKPFLPRRLRLALRRWHARRILRRSRGLWPILESAGRKPTGWPGWSDGKQFAFVLTHDVESQAGLERVKPLAELEMSLGFRSAFYFIPEGPYRVPPALITWLQDNGFEFGVHDLYHDGELVRNRETFRRHAERINRYLRDWNVVGFRAGFMFHNLDWFHDFDIEYDASTFDTDPFEPQSDGVHTICPFWVPKPGSGTKDQRPRVPGPWSLVPGLSSVVRSPKPGCVELPCTLFQDYSLFAVLGEKSSDIWSRKTDWIAQQGGMVLLDMYPDYFWISVVTVAGGRFPARLYREFFEYLRQCDGQSWKALPEEAVNRVRTAHSPVLFRESRLIATVAHSFYKMDNRIMRYAEALVQRGDHVEDFALDAR